MTEAVNRAKAFVPARAERQDREADVALQPRPRAIGGSVEILGPAISRPEVGLERDVAEFLQLVDQRAPLRQRGRTLEIVEDDLLALAVERKAASGRQVREAFLGLLADRAGAFVDDRAEAIFEAELSMLLADQVDDREVGFVLAEP